MTPDPFDFPGATMHSPTFRFMNENMSLRLKDHGGLSRTTVASAAIRRLHRVLHPAHSIRSRLNEFACRVVMLAALLAESGCGNVTAPSKVGPMATQLPRDTDRTFYNVWVENPSTAFDEFFGEPTQAGERVQITTVGTPPSRSTLGLQCPKTEAQDWLNGYIARTKFPHRNEFGQVESFHDFFRYRGEAGGEFEPLDATLELPLVSTKLITPEFIRSAQQEVLSRFPLWRLHVCATYLHSERGVMIYPESVCVGDVQCPPREVESALAAWRPSVDAIRERRIGPRRRQVRLAANLATRALAADSGTDLILLFGSDNWCGDTSCWNVWCVDRTNGAYRAQGEEHGVGDNFHFGADGTFASESKGLESERVAELIQYTFSKPPDSVTDIEIAFRHYKTGNEITFRFPRRIVLSDQQLIAGDTSEWERTAETGR